MKELYIFVLRSLGLSAFKAKAVSQGRMTPQTVLRAYLGGDGSNKMTMLDRGRRMVVILEAWMVKVHEEETRRSEISM